MAAGMAAKSPTAVAISASEMPGPTACRLVLPAAPEILKRTNNAENGSQQSDKRRNRRRGCKPAQILFETPNLLAGAQLQAARDGVGIDQAAARFYLPADFLIALIENGNQGRRTELLARHHYSLEAVGLAKSAQKTFVASSRRAKADHLEKMMVQEKSEKISRMPRTESVSDRAVSHQIPYIRLHC